MGVNYHRVKQRKTEYLAQHWRKIVKCLCVIVGFKRHLIPRSQNRSQLTNHL